MPATPPPPAAVRPAEVQRVLFAAEPGPDVRSEAPRRPVARSPRPGRHVRPSGKVAALAGQGKLFATGPRRPHRPRGAPPPPRHRRAADAGWDELLHGPLWAIDPDGKPPDEPTIYARAEALRLARDAEPVPRDPFGDGLPRLDGLCPCAACALMLEAWREREALRRGGIMETPITRRR